MKINAGMKIPVDGVIIRSSGLITDESAMTGSNEECPKETLKVCR
jgi:cation transport ATPase